MALASLRGGFWDAWWLGGSLLLGGSLRFLGGPVLRISLPPAVGSWEWKEIVVLSLSVVLELSRLGSAPNSVPGASPAQLPYAARAASSAVRLWLSLRTSLLADIVRFGALSNEIRPLVRWSRHIVYRRRTSIFLYL